MDSSSCCFNYGCVFVFLPNLSLVSLHKDGNRLSFYVFGKKICNTTDYFTADYPNLLLSKKTNEELTVTFHAMFRNL